jgi:hypothetical protein
MTAPQTSVITTPDLGIPGQAATFRSADDARVDSAMNQEASAGIPFGRFVQRGTLDKTAKLLTGATNYIAGLAVFGHSFARDTEVNSDGDIMPGVDFGCAEEGEFFVLVAGNVDPTSEVHLFHTVGTGDQLVGTCGPSAVSNKTLDISAFAKWKRTALSGKVGVLSFDLRGLALASADT